MNRTAIAIMLLSLAAGCGDDTQGSADATMPDAPVDAPRLDAPMHDAYGSNCTTLILPATTVNQMYIASAPPTPAGGEIVAGDYVLTAWAIYTGPGGASGPTGTVYHASGRTGGSNGTAYEYLQQINGGIPQPTSGTYTTTDGSAISVLQTCPMRAPLTFTSYDGTSTSFTVYGPHQPSGTDALTFTKQ